MIFRVTVEGERQDLDPIIQDEAYRIAREVLRNAFRHAQASQIEAEIRYDDRLLRVRIRDDGKGIEPEIVEAGGRAGHWGLLGMRERAKRIGARLEFWSEAGAGTEVELSIPSSIAYATSRPWSPLSGSSVRRRRTREHRFQLIRFLPPTIILFFATASRRWSAPNRTWSWSRKPPPDRKQSSNSGSISRTSP